MATCNYGESIGDTVDGCEASKKIICSVEEFAEDEISLTPHLTKLPAFYGDCSL